MRCAWFGELCGCRLVVFGLFVFRCVELGLIVVLCRVSCGVCFGSFVYGVLVHY